MTFINALLNVLGNRRQNQFKDTLVKPRCCCCNLRRSHHGGGHEWPPFGSSQLSRVVSVTLLGFSVLGTPRGCTALARFWPWGMHTGRLSEDTSLCHAQDPDCAGRGLQPRSSGPLRWSGSLLAGKSLGNTHRRGYSRVWPSEDVNGRRLNRGRGRSTSCLFLLHLSAKA